MEGTIVRFKGITLKNIKNTNYGQVKMPACEKGDFQAEILGIYGQNGSGKTAVVDAFYMIQLILMGKKIPNECYHYIDVHKTQAEIEAEFTIEKGTDTLFEVTYAVTLGKKSSDSIEIIEESISASGISAGRKMKKQPFIVYKREDESYVFKPKARFQEVVAGDRKKKDTLAAAKKVAEINNCSYIFGETSFRILGNTMGNAFSDYSFIIKSLNHYASMNLFVIRNSHSGVISADVLLPMEFLVTDAEDQTTARGDFVINLREPTILHEERYELLIKVVEEINIVLTTIIPDLTLGIYDYGTALQGNGSLGRKVDLVSKRGDMEIPIRYESEGIIKIVSILNALIRAYNNPGICLVVDELDAGIYEYLLGELLDIFSKGGKGQIIFTSHNLRPLEMLPSNSILFSTSNPANRYIRMQNIRGTNNLRDVYLRCITLGGQKESIYTETDSIRIARAFRKAGREMEHDR